MANNTEYNGWTNKATWQVHLWLGDYFRDVASQSDWEENIDGLASELEELTWDSFEAESGINPREGSLLLDMLNSSMAEVNWGELAKAAIE